MIKNQNSKTTVLSYFSILFLIISCKSSVSTEQHLVKEDAVVTKTTVLSGVNVHELSQGINNVIQDRKGNYWFSTNANGVYRYDGKTLVQFTQKDGLISNAVWTIQEDKLGNLWFSTGKGLCRFNGIMFTGFTDTLHQVSTVSLDHQKGDIFFNYNGNVYRFDGKIFTLFPIHPDGYKPEPANLDRPYGIYCAFEDRSGNLWFGTDQKGVCRYDGKRFTYFTEKGLDGGAVRSIFQDKNGNLWFGNNGYGLFCYDGKVLRNFTQEMGLDNPAFLKKSGSVNKTENLARVWTINEDNNGQLWVGTVDAGVWKYDGTKLTNFTTKDGLASNVINTIYKDATGDLWFVSDAGINRFNGQVFIKFEGLKVPGFYP